MVIRNHRFCLSPSSTGMGDAELRPRNRPFGRALINGELDHSKLSFSSNRQYVQAGGSRWRLSALWPFLRVRSRGSQSQAGGPENIASGHWFGVRDRFEEHGVIFTENSKGRPQHHFGIRPWYRLHQTYEAVLELDYRPQLAKFAYVQPFLKYLTRPNGTGLVQNARMTRQEEGRRAGTPLRRSVLM